MDQKKIGRVLKDLRKEKNITQEQFAEIVGVSNRSVSRWETGSNMPDLDIPIQIADYYEVDLRDILDGVRKEQYMDKEMEETVLKVADYSNQEKLIIARRMHFLFILGVAAAIVYLFLNVNGLTKIKIYENIASFALGLASGTLVLGVIVTSRYLGKISAVKKRLLKRK